jgi:hypothetical protein
MDYAIGCFWVASVCWFLLLGGCAPMDLEAASAPSDGTTLPDGAQATFCAKWFIGNLEGCQISGVSNGNSG